MAKWKPPRRKPPKKRSRVPTGIGNGIEEQEFLSSSFAQIKAIENLYATAKRVFIKTLTSNSPAAH
jgi:hypothetical protein